MLGAVDALKLHEDEVNGVLNQYLGTLSAGMTANIALGQSTIGDISIQNKDDMLEAASGLYSYYQNISPGENDNIAATLSAKESIDGLQTYMSEYNANKDQLEAEYRSSLAELEAIRADERAARDEAIKNALNGDGDSVYTAVNVTNDSINDINNILTTDIKETAQGTTDAVDTINETLMYTIGSSISEGEEAIDGVNTTLTTTINNSIKEVKSAVSTNETTISGALASLGNSINGKDNSLRSDVVTHLGNVESGLRTAKEEIKNELKDGSGTFGSTVKTIKDKIADITTKVNSFEMPKTPNLSGITTSLGNIESNVSKMA